MKSGLCLLSIVLILGLFPATALAQTGTPQGIVAFVGIDTAGNAALYLIDTAAGKVGMVDAPVTSEADLAWQPDGDMLAFTTDDGGYGVLRSSKGCFSADALCSDVVLVITPYIISHIEWTPDGTSLFLSTEEGVKNAPPLKARPSDFRDTGLLCGIDFKLSTALLCITSDNTGAALATIYDVNLTDLTLQSLYDIGPFTAITAAAIGSTGQAAVGTRESDIDSGFITTPEGAAERLSDSQIHIYDLAFNADNTRLAIIGATADSTGDGSLNDGDTAEFFLYDVGTGQLQQVPGFTGATAAVWVSDDNTVLIVKGANELSLYDTVAQTSQPLTIALPDITSVRSPVWHQTSQMPGIPTATPIIPASPVATPTLAATLTPLPTVTPFPTVAPPPTLTPFPSVTPGSPLGTGCQYAVAAQPVNLNDTAAVTSYGAAVRLRPTASLQGNWIAELNAGTRMKIAGGPWCVDGYRWWQVQLEDGRSGYLADGDQSGAWIQRADVLPSESIAFQANRYAITKGQCVNISWAVEGIKAVYYQGTGVTGSESRVECPATTSNYILTVTRQDGTNVNYSITITVTTP